MVMAQARPFLIAGGGISGFAAALGLAQKGFARFCISPPPSRPSELLRARR